MGKDKLGKKDNKIRTIQQAYQGTGTSSTHTPTEQQNVTHQPVSQPCKPPVYVMREQREIPDPGSLNIPSQPSLYVLKEERAQSSSPPVGLSNGSPPLYVLTRQYDKPVHHPVVLAEPAPMCVKTEDCQNACSQPIQLQSPTCVCRENHSKPCRSKLQTNAAVDQNPFIPHPKSVESPVDQRFSFTVLDSGHLDRLCAFNPLPTSFDEYIQCYCQQTHVLQQYEQLYRKQYEALLAYHNQIQAFQQSQGIPQFHQLQEPPKDPQSTGEFYDVANDNRITISASPRPEDDFTIKEPSLRNKPMETTAITSNASDDSSILCYDVHITITPNGQPHRLPTSKQNDPKSNNTNLKMCAPVVSSPLRVIVMDKHNETLSHDLAGVAACEESYQQGVKTRFCAMTRNKQPSGEVDNEWRSSPLSAAEIKRNQLRSRRRAHPYK